MKKLVASMITAAAAVVMTGCATAPQQVALAENGKTNYTIVYKFSGD